MRRFVRSTLATIIALAIIFVAGAYVLPSEAIVQRETTILATPQAIFPLVNDLRRLKEWSPWADLDPATRYQFEGPDSGVGQKMSWSSRHPSVGSGSITIIASEPDRHVGTALDFGAMGQALAAIDLAGSGSSTAVTWTFKSELRNPLERWLGLLITNDVGADYETGLGKLKAIAEKAPGS